MKKIFLYMHTGSQNHGCEAIVTSTCKILNYNKKYITLFSDNPKEDINSNIDLMCDVKANKEFRKYSIDHVIGTLRRRLFGSLYFYYQNLINGSNSDVIALSIGGDMYCYKGCSTKLAKTNLMLKRKGAQTALWGCSIEPALLNSKNIVSDLNRYDLITSRESITYNALLERGINKNTHLYPDPAFLLDSVELTLPDRFVENNTVGINVSPLIMSLETGENITYRNYSYLVEHIIHTTDMQIALIPHVTYIDNNDLGPLTALYEQFNNTGRVVLLGDKYNCMELKGFISRCRMFIGARTHATIAAYSTCVPTLVVGYSVKARGIARDIFGSEENMVTPVQSLEHEDDLVKAFKYIQENEDANRKHLQDFMPSYIEKAWLAGEEIKKLIEK